MNVSFEAKQIITISGEMEDWNDALKYCRDEGYNVIQSGSKPARDGRSGGFVIRAERPMREEADGLTAKQRQERDERKMLQVGYTEHASQKHHVVLGANFVECFDCKFHAHISGHGYLIQHGRSGDPVRKLVVLGERLMDAGAI